MINLFQILLQPLLNMAFQCGKFNSHSDAGIAGANHAASLDFVRIKPERNEHHGTHLQRDQSFYVAATTTHIGCTALHVRAPVVRKADFQRELDFVASETSLFDAGL